MGKRRIAISMFSAGVMAVIASTAFGQNYPNKPIRIFTTPAGGGNDFSARIVANGISGPLGQSVLVENRPTKLVGEIVSKAQPDGYSLLLAGSSISITPLLEKTGYDPVKDFAPIAMVDTTPSILVVHPSLPVRSVNNLIALAKARPGELNYGSGGIGSANHLATELFKAIAKVNIVNVSYKGSGPAMAALISGEIQLMIPNVGAVTPHLKSGRLRALAVGSATPSELAPGLPTMAASGVPGYDAASLHILLAPASTPAAIINRLNQEVVRLLHRAEVKQRLLSSGVEPLGSSPEELGAYIKADIAKWGKVIKEAGIRAD